MRRRGRIATLSTLMLALALALPAGFAQRGSNAVARVQVAIEAMPLGTLSQQEIAGVVWMREEEKLARDVYQELGAMYDLPVFDNIAASEQSHMDAVAVLLERYGIADPAAGKAPGEFTDPQLQQLYDQLTAQGALSLRSALEVGATIEEVDIADLRARASQAPDVALVYDVLERGSENHLRAFTRLYAGVAGSSYQPQYLQPDDYARIVSGV